MCTFFFFCLNNEEAGVCEGLVDIYGSRSWGLIGFTFQLRSICLSDVIYTFYLCVFQKHSFVLQHICFVHFVLPIE